MYSRRWAGVLQAECTIDELLEMSTQHCFAGSSVLTYDERGVPTCSRFHAIDWQTAWVCPEALSAPPASSCLFLGAALRGSAALDLRDRVHPHDRFIDC